MEILSSLQKSFSLLIENDILKIIAGGIIGASISVFVQWRLRVVKRNKIKKTINNFLVKSVLVDIKTFEEDIKKVRINIKTFNHEVLGLEDFQVLNTKILNSFPVEEIRHIYEDKFVDFIKITSIINSLEKRTPHITWNKFIDVTDKHLKESPKDKCQFKDDAEHYNRCNFIISKIKIYNLNLNHLEEMISDLKGHIETITSEK